MLITLIIILLIFLFVIILISLSKIDRSTITLTAGILTLLVLKLFENIDYKAIASFIVGTPQDGYVNLHALIFIFGMLVIIQLCIEGGVFQYLSFRLIQMTKGKPTYLLIGFCSISFFLAAILNDILAIMLLIPLTITVCKILDIDAVPYIITEAITIKLGATLFLISSIPSILVGTYLELTFMEFFLDIGVITIVIFVLTLFIFIGIYHKKLTPPRKGIDMLLEFNVGKFIANRSLMYKSILILIAVIICFIVIPPNILSPDIIALIGAVILVIISGIEPEHTFEKIDFKLILYLIGVFLTVGGLKYIGMIYFFGSVSKSIAPNDILLTFLITLWFSALFSGFVDNTTAANILIPTVRVITLGYHAKDKIFIYAGMIYGINWGDNLTPFGDTVIMIDFAEKNGCRIKPSAFFRIGFPIALLQLSIITIIYSLIINLIIGLIFLSLTIGLFVIFFLRVRLKNKISFNNIKLKEYKNKNQKRK